MNSLLRQTKTASIRLTLELCYKSHNQPRCNYSCLFIRTLKPLLSTPIARSSLIHIKDESAEKHIAQIILIDIAPTKSGPENCPIWDWCCREAGEAHTLATEVAMRLQGEAIPRLTIVINAFNWPMSETSSKLIGQ